MADTAAARIIKERPDYSLFENNCQNFAKYLVEAISPASKYPETIHNFLQKWVPPAGHSEASTQLPGTYPSSPTTTEPQSESYYSASEDTWTSDLESLNSTDGENLALIEEVITPASIPSGNDSNGAEAVETDLPEPRIWEDLPMAGEIDRMYNRVARSTLPAERKNSRGRDSDTNKVIHQILKYMDRHQCQYGCIMNEEGLSIFKRSGSDWVVVNSITI